MSPKKVECWAEVCGTVGGKDPTGPLKTLRQPDMMAHVSNASIGQAEAGGSWRVLGLHGEKLCPVQTVQG